MEMKIFRNPVAREWVLGLFREMDTDRYHLKGVHLDVDGHTAEVSFYDKVEGEDMLVRGDVRKSPAEATTIYENELVAQ